MDLPPEACGAARKAVWDAYTGQRPPGMDSGQWCDLLADAALKAAAPHLAAAERETCARLADDEADTLAASEGTGHRALRRFAALLREEDPRGT